jgi:hypothetical protein
MSRERRRLILGAAIVAVLGFAAWTFWPSTPPSGGPAPAQSRVRGGRPGQDGASGGPVGAVKLEALRGGREEPGGEARNPFRFQPKAPPPQPRDSTPVMTETSRPTPSLPPGPPPVPPMALKLIGVLERATGVKWAVMSDGKSAPMYGKDGDILDGKYLIVKVGTESVEMTYADGRGRQVIRLTGQ